MALPGYLHSCRCSVVLMIAIISVGLTMLWEPRSLVITLLFLLIATRTFESVLARRTIRRRAFKNMIDSYNARHESDLTQSGAQFFDLVSVSNLMQHFD